MRDEWERPKWASICLKCFLRRVSDKGTHLEEFLTWNNGRFLPEGVMSRRFLSAWTGQMGEAPKWGIFRTLAAFFACIVLVQVMRIWAPGGAKKTSARANCLVGSKELIEWGTKLEILRNEKNDNK